MTKSTRAVVVAFLLPLCGFAASSHAQEKPVPYSEEYRPQFHFTSTTDWINDPNGLVYFEGEYHLFFQRYPGGVEPKGIVKSWGHAVSPDLVHWTQLKDALDADDVGSIWSGSAVVDRANAAGFGANALIAFYTNAKDPFDQRLAHSTDRGRTWTKVAKPIIPHIHGGNRDPKVVWHEASKQWVLALYLDRPNQYALFASTNLKDWQKLHDVTLEGDNECPDFFPIKLDGKTDRWVFMGANNRYLVGTFDGKTFTPETDSLPSEHGPSFYAAQTFSDLPDGRRVQIGWMRDRYIKGMPFNQQLSVPADLTLRTTPRGPRLFRYPVKELETLRNKHVELKDVTLTANDNPLADLAGQLFDLDIDLDLAAAQSVTLKIRGHDVTLRREGNQVSLASWDRRAAIPAPDGRVKIRVLVDRTSIELFAQDGLVVMSGCFVPPADQRVISLTAEGGPAKVVSLDAYELNSSWPVPAW